MARLRAEWARFRSGSARALSAGQYTERQVKGEPLYAATGVVVTGRFDIPMPDGEALPAAHMVRPLV